MAYDVLREASLRGAMARLAAFTYLALGVSWFLVSLYSPYYDNFDRHPAWLTACFALGLPCPLLIIFARSGTTRWVGALPLWIAVVLWVFQPDGGLQ